MNGFPKIRLMIVAALLLAGPWRALAEPKEASPSEQAQMAGASFLTTKEFSLSLSVMAFGLLIAGAACYLRDKLGSSELLFKLLALVIISTLGVVLITAGYSDKQMAPIVGLLGTALGYALGKAKE